MSDETENGHAGRGGASRRLFLKGAGGVAAASVAAVLAPRAWVQAQAQPTTPEPSEACCASAAETPLLAAALFQGRHVALAASSSGPGLFALDVDSGRRVSLGARLDLQLPEGFTVASMGVVRGRLAVTGGMPFVFESYEVNDEMTEDVRAAMDVIPEGMPTSGTRRIDVMGVRPAVLLIDLQSAVIESLDLPAMPARAFAVVTGVAETASGALLVMIEHSDRFNEAYYASAVDVFEQSLNGQWTSQDLARDLGESGPHYLAVSGDSVAVALNSQEGARLLSGTSAALTVDESTVMAGRILALTAGNGGLAWIASSAGSVHRYSSAQPGATVDAGAVSLRGDSIVGAVPVAGAWGQSILLGRQSALLVDDSARI